MGALAGTARILNIATIRELGISDRELGQVALLEQSEMQRREQLYRGGRPAAALQGKIAIVVDDGLATGSTMMAAVRYIRSLSPEKVIVAIPVGSREAVSRLRREADDVICITIPESFYAVSQWYRDFTQVSDDEVRNLLAANHRRHAKSLTSSAAG
jgi:putative phosphoribosyl transferase